MGVRGPQRQDGALRRTGWRPPLLPREYQILVSAIASRRPEFKNASTREVLEAALRELATVEEFTAAKNASEKIAPLLH